MDELKQLESLSKYFPREIVSLPKVRLISNFVIRMFLCTVLLLREDSNIFHSKDLDFPVVELQEYHHVNLNSSESIEIEYLKISGGHLQELKMV